MIFNHSQTVHISLVGRTNTGKSTLFNRLIGKSYAIEGASEHLTRDVRVHQNGNIEFADFPGLNPTWFQSKKRELDWMPLIHQALSESHIILWVLDVHTGLTSEDMAIFDIFKRLNKPWIAVVNKVDHDISQPHWHAKQGAPRGDYVFVSASHKLGFEALMAQIQTHAPNARLAQTDQDTPCPIYIACVGRTNSGKSSFCNQVLGDKRVRVSAEAHTTRDLIEMSWPLFPEQDIRLMDTAGILMSSPELAKKETGVSVLQSRRAIEKAQLAFFFIDATVGMLELDKKIYHLLKSSYTTIVVIVNKWDASNRVWKSQREARETILYCTDHPHHVVFHSTHGEFNPHAFKRLIHGILEERQTKIATPHINDWLEKLKSESAYPVLSRIVVPKYAVQKGHDPLRVYCFCKHRPRANRQALTQAKKMLHRSFLNFFDIRYGPVFFSLRK